MKRITLLYVVLMLAAVESWASPSIVVNADSLEFGQVDVGYPVTKTMVVTGHDLTDNINLSIIGRYSTEYEVSPSIIKPEDAAAGVAVRVTYRPRSAWSNWATLILTSADAADVQVPITADPQRNGTISGYNNQRSYNASVGRSDHSVEVAYFADAEIPPQPDPDTPVVRSMGLIAGNYEVSIDGDNCFRAQIVRSSALVNTCTVQISYKPRTSGSHHATLDVICPNAGVPLIRVYLEGTATPPTAGDLDYDGMITINDVTSVIDLLMMGACPSSQADVDGDGTLSINDVTDLIDLLLSF